MLRSTELRVQGVEADERPSGSWRSGGAPLRIIANRPDTGLPAEYEHKLREARDSHHLPRRRASSSSRSGQATRRSSPTGSRAGVEVGGHHVLTLREPRHPERHRRVLLHARDVTGKIPHAYFGWTEGNPIVYLLKFLAFGEGDTAPVTREVLRQAEPNP